MKLSIKHQEAVVRDFDSPCQDVVLAFIIFLVFFKVREGMSLMEKRSITRLRHFRWLQLSNVAGQS
jgi:hypothetical protein